MIRAAHGARARRGSLIIAFAALAACGGGAAVRPPGAPAPRGTPTNDVAKSPSSTRSLTLQIDFAAGRLHVRVAATGTADEIRVWRLGDDVARVEVGDESGHAIPFGRDGHRLETTGGQATVIVSYDLGASASASASASEDVRSTLIEPARFRAIGERILALPEAFESKPVAVSLDQRSTEAPVVASSFGIARERVARQLEIPGSALRRAVFLAGAGGRAEFDAPEGHDESAWLGYTAFDPRAVSAEVAGFRGLLHEYFHDIELPPATLFFTVDVRPRGHFRVLRTHSGVLVALSGTDPYDAPLRLAVAHELVHGWIGERVWLGDASPGHEVESYWFHEGVTRWVAREQLARVGLLSSDEYAGEVSRLLAIVTTSRHGARPMKDLVSDRAATGIVPLLVARGALFATVADARIREASHGTRSFDDALRALATRASEHPGPLPAEALAELLATELGPARAREDFDEVVVLGRRKRIPDAALGACFEAQEVSYEIYEPGFDVAASRAAHAIVGVEPKGPAAAAGLREGDVLTTADVPDRVDQTARVTVERGGKALLIAYRPVSGSRRGQGFRRKPGLSEDACRKLALRH